MLTTEALVYDRRRKNYLSLYNTGTCYNSVNLLPGSIVGPVGALFEVVLLGFNTTTEEWEPLPVPLYSSQNSAIASVNSAGTVELEAPGSTTVKGQKLLPKTVFFDCSMQTMSDTAPVTVSSSAEAVLSCPSSVTRGQSITCTASVNNAPSGATVTFEQWKFKVGSTTMVTRTTNTGSATWPGKMVTSGTVSVRARVNGSLVPNTPTRTVTVNNRNWHTNPASPSAVPNGVIVTLPAPPQPNFPQPGDSGLGVSEEQTGHQSFSHTVIGDNGPNHGFAYYATQPTFSPLLFRYTIHPDLENSSSTFSQQQCGDYNASTNPNGFIAWFNLIIETRRHEYNSTTQSHHAFYANAMNSTANNPGRFVESRMAPPGAVIEQFNQDTASGLTVRYAAILSATEVQPFPVNYSETGVPLGNINCAPYVPCN